MTTYHFFFFFLVGGLFSWSRESNPLDVFSVCVLREESIPQGVSFSVVVLVLVLAPQQLVVSKFPSVWAKRSVLNPSLCTPLIVLYHGDHTVNRVLTVEVNFHHSEKLTNLLNREKIKIVKDLPPGGWSNYVFYFQITHSLTLFEQVISDWK